MADMIVRMGSQSVPASGGHYIEIPSAGPEGMAYVYINTVGTIAWSSSPPAIEDTALGATEAPAEPERPADDDNAVVEGDDA